MEYIPELLQLVDESRIAFRPAVELSYLKKEEQSALLEEISYTDATPTAWAAMVLHGKSLNELTDRQKKAVERIIGEPKSIMLPREV